MAILSCVSKEATSICTVRVIGPRTDLREAKEILQRGKGEGKSTERRRTALYEIAKGIITYFLRSCVAA